MALIITHGNLKTPLEETGLDLLLPWYRFMIENTLTVNLISRSILCPKIGSKTIVLIDTIDHFK